MIDKTVGSPLADYVFVTNGKSVINGQERALLRVNTSLKSPLVTNQLSFDDLPQRLNLPKTQPQTTEYVIDASVARTVNELARKRFQHKLLADILVDLQICTLEGWSKTEYLDQLKSLINSFSTHKDAVKAAAVIPVDDDGPRF